MTQEDHPITCKIRKILWEVTFVVQGKSWNSDNAERKKNYDTPECVA